MRTGGSIISASVECFVLVGYSRYLCLLSFLSFWFMSVFTIITSLGALESNSVTATMRNWLYQLFS